MNFALLGDDPAVLPLIRTVAAHSDHQLTHATACDSLADELLRATPSVRIVQSRDELPAGDVIEAVIVAGEQSVVLDGARQLASAGKPLLVFPRVGQESAFAYELTLVRDEKPLVAVPAFPALLRPEVRELQQSVADGRLGRLRFLELERRIPETAGPAVLPVAAVEAALLEDIVLARMLCGDYHQVTALYSGKTEEGISRATITLAGEGLPETTWSARPGTTAERRWTVTGEQGAAVLSARENNWHVEWKAPATEVPPSPNAASRSAEFNEGATLLAHFEQAIAGREPRPDWTDLTRALEAVEATRRSIRRRRTIDVPFEATSERNIFKTQMTAVGCGLLTLTLVGVLALLAIGTLFDPRHPMEVRAETADAVLRREAFVKGSAELTPAARDRLEEVARGMPGGRFPVLVEQTGEKTPSQLDRRRRERVAALLERMGVAHADTRTVTAPLHGGRFDRVMRVARLVVFVPLGLFLLLQLLIFVARPSSARASKSSFRA